jgi:hypothetical protein
METSVEDAVAAERERVALLVESAMRSLAKAIRNGDTVAPRRKRKQPEATETPRPKVTSASPMELAIINRIWGLYPRRPEPYPFVAVRTILLELLQGGHTEEALVTATMRYAQDVQRQQIDPKYITGMVRFFRDGLWQQYADASPRVFGRSREEWARSGQDVLEFDRLAGEIRAKETMSR